MSRVLLQPAYILHHRKYRESSMLLDIITPDHGRISLVANSVRKVNSRSRPLLQNFRALFISWQGKTDLQRMLSVEENGRPQTLSGTPLACAYYLNELLLRLLPLAEENVQVFALYHQCLQQLSKADNSEKILRYFEVQLLTILGLAADFDACVNGYEAVDALQRYTYDAEYGAIALGAIDEGKRLSISGETLLALSEHRLEGAVQLSEAKRLMRYLMRYHLGDKPLQSRSMFRHLSPDY